MHMERTERHAVCVPGCRPLGGLVEVRYSRMARVQGEEINSVLDAAHEITCLESRSHGQDGKLATAIVQVRRYRRTGDNLHAPLRGVGCDEHRACRIRELRVRRDGRVTTLRQRTNPHSEAQSGDVPGTLDGALQLRLLRCRESR